MNRGRDLEQILSQYTTFVKPAFEEFCLPVRSSTHCDLRLTSLKLNMVSVCFDLQTKKYADVIIPRGVDNMGMLASFSHSERVQADTEPVRFGSVL